MFFKRYLKDVLPFKRFLAEAVLLMFFISGIQLLLPQFIRAMLDDFIPNHKLNQAFQYFCLLVAAFLLRGAMIVRRNHQMLHFGYGFILHLRMRIMRHLQLLSSRYYDRVPMGDIMTRMLDDIMNIENMTTNSLLNLVTDGIIVLGVLALLFKMQWTLALAALLVMPFYVINFKYFRQRLRARNRAIQRNYADLSSEFSESISGIRVIKSFSLEEFRRRKLEQFFNRDVFMRIRTYTLNAVFQVISEFLTVLGTAIVLFYGGYMVMSGRITIGEVVAFYTYVGYLYSPLIQLVGMTQLIQRGMVSVERVYELLDTAPWPAEKKDAVDPRPVKGFLEFRNVSFVYDHSRLPALSNVSFSLGPGRTAALVGASGAGKSTILNLALRFYDPTQGIILIDGRDIRDFQINAMRNAISIVLQEGFLFSGTVFDNIRMGRLQASENEVIEAAKTARAWDFIQTLPEGMETLVGERGMKLSGGQKQLLAMARAVLRNASIVLLDEPTSALDSETESLVQKSMDVLRQKSAVIIIAHRLSTVRSADEILAMHKGEIIERGTHEALLAQNGYYTRLYGLQFGTRSE